MSIREIPKYCRFGSATVNRFFNKGNLVQIKMSSTQEKVKFDIIKNSYETLSPVSLEQQGF
jgi:hypothetical protein